MISFQDDENGSSDDEQKMLLRHCNDIKQSLLANSDDSGSDADDSSDASELSELELSSDDESVKRSKKEKPERAKATKSIETSAISDAEEKIEKTEEEEEEEESSSIAPPAQQTPLDYSKTENGKAKSGEETASDHEQQAKKRRIKRDSFEREIFSKDFLETNGNTTNKPPATPSASMAKNERAPNVDGSNKQSENVDGTIDVSMFENKRPMKDTDLQKVFERREINRSAISNVAGPPSVLQPKPAPIIHEDEWISLSSDSDSEINVQAAGSSARLPKRKKMLTEEELQEETKKAQKEETQRVERLKKKNEMLTQHMSQESDNELVLDYDRKKDVAIKVHPKLSRLLKDHQKEGVKFMYDTCFGSISDDVKTESGCILAHCMGLGKTLQLIALLHTLIRYPKHLNTKRVLVICPKSTIMNWYEEFSKWLNGIDSRGLKIYYLEDQLKMHERLKVTFAILATFPCFSLHFVRRFSSSGTKATVPEFSSSTTKPFVLWCTTAAPVGRRFKCLNRKSSDCRRTSASVC